MRALLDTHTFIWAALDSKKLSARVRRKLKDPENEIFVSAVTFWEISLKSTLGKLALTGLSPDQMPKVADDLNMRILDLSAEVSASFHELPRVEHRDPFDRMLIWQAISLDLQLISKDAKLDVYSSHGLRLFW